MNRTNHIFKKMYGQNFIKDDNIIKKIIDCAAINKDTLVIEIGAGSGALTKSLCNVSKGVICYEIDNSLFETLTGNLKMFSNVEIIWEDFLKRDLKQDLSKYNYEYLYVVANLPYYITTPIINKIIAEHIKVDKIVIMVQKEVGDRITALPGNKDYGSLTVFLNYYFDMKKEFIVSRNSFYPRPNVDSIVISLVRKKEQMAVKDSELFFKLIKDSFKFKRKNLKNNLDGYDLKKINAILKKYNMDTTARAENLDISVFVDIANNI